MNILLTVSYDGTNYCGWQRQVNGPTIQANIEKALELTYNREITIQGASRTDAGVHAKGQRAAFALEPGDLKIPVEKIACVLNTLLPQDIRIIRSEEISAEFHPVYSAIKKTYEYKIYNAPIADPISRLYCEHIRPPMDMDKMLKASKYFIGEHDFKAFCASGGSAKTSVRIIYSISLKKHEDIISMQVTGNGFLYNMVRIIAGTLINISLNKIETDAIPEIIKSLDRTKAGKTAPAKGLTLLEIYY